MLVPDLYHGSIGTDKEEALHVRAVCRPEPPSSRVLTLHHSHQHWADAWV